MATMTMITTDNNYARDDVVERYVSASSPTMACKREKKFFFLLFRVFFNF
jgi:hypothetical protein